MSDSPSHCGNCAAPLTGPFCAQCGQSAHESARSMHALFHDGWHSLTHLDGRLWRTLGLLLWKPGEVSRQFIANRRASFLPPFRLYLVLSLLFFGLFSTTRNEDIMRVQFTVSERETVCQDLKVRPQWLAERMRATCRKALADEGASLRDAFVASLPRAMFLFLPLIAAGMLLLLYWRPRRWYVEHLVFFLHNHSAAFLVGSAVALVQLAARAWPALSAVASFTVAGMFCWLAVYLFLAMRRFYGQGRRRTFAKLLVISLFYAMSMVLMVGLTALYSALTL